MERLVALSAVILKVLFKISLPKKICINQPCLSDSMSVLMLFDESISICYTGGQLAFS